MESSFDSFSIETENYSDAFFSDDVFNIQSINHTIYLTKWSNGNQSLHAMQPGR